MQIHHVIKIISLVLAVFLLTGCGGGSTPIRYYLVDPVEYSNAGVDAEGELSVEILDVHIPQYLERFHIASRGDERQLYFSGSDQWGENLRKNLLRTLARNLSVLLATNDIATPLNRSMSLPDYRIQVHIEQFERDYDGIVKLVARWQLLNAGGGPDSVVTHKAELRNPGYIAADDFDRIVPAMQSLFGQLSEKIAESLRSVVADIDRRTSS